jgi:oligopeptide transport system ATP-binding protein
MSLLKVRGLEVRFPVREGILSRKHREVRAVDGVDLDLEPGKTLGLVGESGCGKTTTGRAILRLIEPNAGEILVDGTDVRKLGSTALRRFRRHMQIIFQDPYSSLDPRRTVGQSVEEGLEIHDLCPTADRAARVAQLFDRVGLSQAQIHRHPHEFSGGQRQRVGIARALAVEPKLLILDEPVSALDVSVQAQVINLLEDLQAEKGLGYLFVAHDMGVVRHVSQTIAVMYLGRIVEKGPTEEICRHPQHPYTKLLIASVPRLGDGKGIVAPARGELPSPMDPPSGCTFHPRCPMAASSCKERRPALIEVTPGHQVACPVVSGHKD